MLFGGSLGYVRVRGTVANPSDRSLRVELEFVVDTGAIYTVIPKSVAERLRLKEMGRRRFKIANGDIVEYPVSEAYIIINGEG
jgi:predicted aspartyl protease